MAAGKYSFPIEHLGSWQRCHGFPPWQPWFRSWHSQAYTIITDAREFSGKLLSTFDVLNLDLGLGVIVVPLIARQKILLLMEEIPNSHLGW